MLGPVRCNISRGRGFSHSRFGGPDEQIPMHGTTSSARVLNPDRCHYCAIRGKTQWFSRVSRETGPPQPLSEWGREKEQS